MPSYTPGLTYIAAVVDALLLKLRLGDETTDSSVIGVCVGSPEGQVVGSPGDIRIEIPGEVGGPVGLWQKESGELNEFGWVQIGTGGGGGANPNDTFVTYTANGDLPNARVLVNGTNTTVNLTVPGQVSIDAAATPVTLQAAITGQGVAPTTQNFDTTIGLTGGAAWIFQNNASLSMFTIDDDAAVGIAITGQDTAAGAGQQVRIGGGVATVAGQDGGDVVLAAGAASGAGLDGLVEISSAWALDATISPAALAAGNNNNYAPTNGTITNTWRLTPNAAGSTITGITGGQAGRKLELFNLSTGTVVVLTHNDTGNSTAANCFFLPGSASLTIPPNGSVSLWYDAVSSRWRIDSEGEGNATLQIAINNQGTTPTEQAITTSIDLNAGTGQWRWRDAANANLMSVADVAGVTIDQALAYTGDISPAALAAGATADYAPAGLATATVLRLTPNAAGSTLTGLTTGSDGRRIFIFNLSTTADLTLLHDDGASSAAVNRFLCPNNTSVIIPPNGGVSIVYDSTSTRWRVVTPQQQSAFFQPASQSTVGAVVATFPIADLPNPGDRILIRGLLVSAIFTAGVAAGDIGQIAGTLDVQAQNSTTDGVVVAFATQPWGPPPTAILQPTSTGYQPPLAFGSPGGVAVAVVVAGTQVQVQCTGIGGFTIRFDVLGDLFLFGTAARLVQ